MVQKILTYQNNLPLSSNFAPGLISGLVINHSGGIALGIGAAKVTAAGTVTVPDNVAFSVYVSALTGVPVAVATSALPTSNALLIWDGVSAGGQVTSLRDLRSWTSTSLGTLSTAINPQNDWDTWVTSKLPEHYWAMSDDPVSSTTAGAFQDTGSDVSKAHARFLIGNGVKNAEGPFGATGRVALQLPDNLTEELAFAEGISTLPLFSPSENASWFWLMKADDLPVKVFQFAGVRNSSSEFRVTVKGDGGLQYFVRNSSGDGLQYTSPNNNYVHNNNWGMVGFTSPRTTLNFLSGYIDAVLVPFKPAGPQTGEFNQWFGNTTGSQNYFGLGRTRYGLSPGTTSITVPNVGNASISSMLIDTTSEFSGLEVLQGYRAFAGNPDTGTADTFRQAVSQYRNNLEEWWQCYDNALLEGLSAVGSPGRVLTGLGSTAPTFLSAGAFSTKDHGRPGSLAFNGTTDALFNTAMNNNEMFITNTVGVIGMLFKCDSKTSARTVWSLSDSTANTRGAVTIDTNGYPNLQMYRGTAATDYQSQLQVDVADNNWHFLCATQRADGNGITWHLDGTNYAAASASVVETTGASVTVDEWFNGVVNNGAATPTRMALGALSGNTISNRFSGSIQDVFVLNAGLSDVQLNEIWSRASGNLN